MISLGQQTRDNKKYALKLDSNIQVTIYDPDNTTLHSSILESLLKNRGDNYAI